MTSMYKKVCQFQEALGKPKNSVPKFPDTATRELHGRLLLEEYKELINAEVNEDLVNVAEEISDMIYILCGIACKYGIPLDEIFDGIHKANMRKVNVPGGPILNNGKLKKPEGWKKSNTARIMKKSGYTSE